MPVYAIADLHGNYSIFKKVINLLNPEDTLIVLGDLADRGLDGYKIIKEVLSNDNILYLKGNHEELFLKAAEYSSLDDSSELKNTALTNLFANGGLSTYSDWLNDKDKDTIIQALKSLPTNYIYQNKNNQRIFLSHSGALEDPLWDRKHFLEVEEILPCNADIIIHGHTPVPSLYYRMTGQRLEGPVEPACYNGGNKIDIDLGTPTSKRAYLINLDTLEGKIIEA